MEKINYIKKSKMKNIKFIILLIASGFLFSCQTNNYEQDHDAVFKTIKKVYELNEDGSMNYQYEHQLKYITHYSFNRMYGESFIIYNPEEQNLNIKKAETTMADGTLVPSPENAFNEVLPRFASGAPAFNHLREMVVTHTGLELGCMVDFEYELNTNEGYYPYFNDNILIGEDVPVEKYEIVISVPKGKELNYKLINSDVEPIVKNKEEKTIYTWKFKDIDAIPHEANMPHDNLYLPHLIFSDISLEQATTNLAYSVDLELTPDIKKAVNRLLSGKEKGIRIINDLQKMIGTNMNDFNIPFEYTGYSVRPLKEVWLSNGATRFEKVFLFNEMLNYAGINSKIVFAIPSQTYDSEIGNLINYGHAYVLANVEGEKLIVSCNEKQKNNLAFEVKNDVLTDIEGTKISIPEFVKETINKITATGNFDLTKAGALEGKMEMEVSGVENPYLLYLSDSDNSLATIKSMVPDFAIKDHTIKSIDHSKSEIQATIQMDKIWKKQDNYYFIGLFNPSLGIASAHLQPLLNERVAPLTIGNSTDETYDFTITLPDGFEFVGPSVDKEVTNILGSVKVSITSESNKLHIVKKLAIPESKISPEEYVNFKQLMNLWQKEEYHELVFKKTD